MSHARQMLVCVCILIASFVSPALGDEPARGGDNEVLARAERLFTAGKIKQAQSLVEPLAASARGTVDLSPSAVRAVDLLAELYMTSGRYSDARELANRWGEHLDRSSASTDTSAHDLRDRARFENSARQALVDIAVAADPNLAGAVQAGDHIRLAVSLAQRRAADASLRELEAHVRLAEAVTRHGQADEAQALWQSILSQAEKLGESLATESRFRVSYTAACRTRSKCLMALERHEEAIRALEDLLATGAVQDEAAIRVQVLADIASLHARLGRHTAEQQWLQQALDEQEDSCRARSVPRPDETSASAAAVARELARAADLRAKLAISVEAQEGEGTDVRNWWASAVPGYQAALVRIEPLEVANDEAETQDRFYVRIQALEKLQAAYVELRDYVEAARTGELLLATRREALDAVDPRIFQTESLLGSLYARQNRFAEAEPHLRAALPYWRTRIPSDPLQLAGTLNNLSAVCLELALYGEALELAEGAIKVYEPLLPKGDLRLGEVYTTAGSVLAAQGRYAPARDRHLQAIAIFEQQREVASEPLSMALLNVAMTYKSQLRLDSAAEYCQRALQERESHHQGPPSVLLPYYVALADLDIARQDLPSAAASCGRAWALLAGDPSLERSRLAGRIAHQVALLHYLSEDPSDWDYRKLVMQRSWEHALVIQHAEKHHSMEARSLNYLAQLALSDDDLERADEFSRQAVELADKLDGFPSHHYMARCTRARVLLALAKGLRGGPDASAGAAEALEAEAIRLLEQAVDEVEAPRASTIGAESERAEYFSQFSTAFDLLVDLHAAKGDYVQALRYAERGRNRTFLDQLRATGLELRDTLRGTPYEETLLKREEKLLERMGQLHRVRAEVADARQRGADEASRAAEVQLNDLKAEYVALRTQIRDASPLYRGLLSVNSETSPDAWSRIRAQIARLGCPVLFYYLGHAEGHLFLIHGDPQQIEHFTLRIPAEVAPGLALPRATRLTEPVARQLVVAYRDLLRDKDRSTALATSREAFQAMLNGLAETTTDVGPRRDLGPAELDVDRPARPGVLRFEKPELLTDVLLPPAARRQIARLEPPHVVIIPDGALHELPFEALVMDDQSDDQGQASVTFLLDEKSFPPIAYGPSLSILARLQERSTSGEAPTLLTLGHPLFGAIGAQGAAGRSHNPIAVEFMAAGGNLVELPGTKVECEQVRNAFASRFGEPSVTLLSERDATEARLRDALRSQRRFLHLATHGVVTNDYANLLGAIVLTPPNDARPPASDDGFLSLFEVYDLPLVGYDLAVLSACQTNVGPAAPLETGSSFARGFLAAGAKRVVSSHWSVDDQSTSKLVTEYFEQLAEAVASGRPADYARALQAARRSIRRDWPAPYHWSPFVLIGPPD